MSITDWLPKLVLQFATSVHYNLNSLPNTHKKHAYTQMQVKHVPCLHALISKYPQGILDMNSCISKLSEFNPMRRKLGFSTSYVPVTDYKFHPKAWFIIHAATAEQWGVVQCVCIVDIETVSIWAMWYSKGNNVATMWHQLLCHIMRMHCQLQWVAKRDCSCTILRRIKMTLMQAFIDWRFQ